MIQTLSVRILNTGRSLSGFQNRTVDVFASLGGLEKAYDDGVKEREREEEPGAEEGEDAGSSQKLGGDTDDAAFKRPPFPPRGGGSRMGHWNRKGRGGQTSHCRSWDRKRQRTPDHKVHPERWTEYTLEDTPLAGESANKRAAFDFLRELRERKAKEQSSEKWDADLHCGKIEFKKPAQLKDGSYDESAKASSVGSVHKMPEYVIGKGKQKSSKAKKVMEKLGNEKHATVSDSSISLEHLGDEEERNGQSDESTGKIGQSVVNSGKIDKSDVSIDKISQSDVCSVKINQSESKGGSAVAESSQSGEEKPDKGQSVSFQKKGKSKRNIRGRKNDEED